MVNEDNLAVGDVVVLQSGGPKMTVVSVQELVQCFWFVVEHPAAEMQKGWFVQGALRKISS